MEKYVFGVDVGGTTIKFGFFDDRGEVIEKWEYPTNTEDNGINILPDIASQIENKLNEKNLTKEDIIGVGIGVPGPVTDDGVVIKCANLGWGVINVNEELSKQLGIKVKTGNDANVAALGEMFKGGAKGSKDVVVITLGTGVGGGIILDGKIRCGFNGGAGEIGHFQVEQEEADACGCGGHGHLEQYASATGILRMTKKALANSFVETKLREIPNFSTKDIFDLAKAGDKFAYSMVDKMCYYLALALKNISCTIDPEVFVIGGGVSRAGNIIIERIEEHYNQNILTALANKEFKLATLGNDAGIYGCACLILG